VGHLFVAQGDLTRLACDAIVIPCDKQLNVNKAWESILPDGLPPGDGSDWLRLEGAENAHGVVTLPDADHRKVRAFVAVEVSTTPHDVIDRLWNALDDVSDGLVPADYRVQPLIGIPLVGTGYGGLEGRRTEVIEELLQRHRSRAPSVDLAR
jgi:hypothetical protein